MASLHPNLRARLRRAGHLLRSIARAHLVRPRTRAQPAFLLISVWMSETGAPLVLNALIEEIARDFGSRHVRLITLGTDSNRAEHLRTLGVAWDPAVPQLPGPLAKLQLAARRDSIVLLNGLVVPMTYLRTVTRLLHAGKLDHAFWFIHEPQDIATQWFASVESSFLQQVATLTGQGRLTILVPSVNSRDFYSNVLNSTAVEVIGLRVDISQRHLCPRSPSDYSTVTFLVVGGIREGRKGHFDILRAFELFLDYYYSIDQENYRDFKMKFIGISSRDPLLDELRSKGMRILGERLEIYGPQSHDDTLELSQGCNVVISYSKNESFSLSVAEGMAMGHVVLRNETGGSDEQLVDSVNGFLLRSGDIDGFARVLAILLSRSRTSDAELYAMGAESQRIIKPYLTESYVRQLDRILASKELPLLRRKVGQ